MRDRVGACLLLLVAATVPAAAQPWLVHVVAVGAPPGSCPSAVLVGRELERLLPDVRTVPASDGRRADRVLIVSEEPGGLRVEVSGQVRHLADATRACEQRAKMAAVSASLLLEWKPEREPVIVESAGSTTPPPVIRRRRHPHVAIAASARLAAGLPVGGPGLLTGGAGLRVVLGGARWRAALGLAFDAPATVAFPGLDVRVLRAPVDLSVQVALLSRRQLALDLEAGAWLAIVRLSYSGGDPQPGYRWDGGLRLALSLALRILGPLHAVLRLEDDLSLAPIPVGTLHPPAVVGDTPRDWLVLELGLALVFP